MEQLSYQAAKKAGYPGFLLQDAPEKVMQFGEGNFLRAFAVYWFDIANEKAQWRGKIAIVKPTPSTSQVWQKLNAQQGLYTLHLRGLLDGECVEQSRVISSVSRCINPYEEEGFGQMMALAVSDDLELVVSNTTEAGIVYDPACTLEDRPCATFPGKLTQVLYARFRAGKPGLVMLPCELNDHNGQLLKNAVLQYAGQWKLEPEFINYVNLNCLFCNTLVDRIVPGTIRNPEEVRQKDVSDGYRDDLRVVGEVFGVWNIEGPAWLEEKLPFAPVKAHCAVVPDVTPYKNRKVRILNGAHTGMVLLAYLAGFDIVRDCVNDGVISAFLRKMLRQEIIPTLHMDQRELERYADDVLARFGNPFIDHALLSISLNSTAKWRTRNLPALLAGAAQGNLPVCLALGLAACIAFYSSDVQSRSDRGLVCRRPKGDCYTCCDETWVLDFYWTHREDSPEALVHGVMTNEEMWGQDLTRIPGLEALTVSNLKRIREVGAMAAFEACL